MISFMGYMIGIAIGAFIHRYLMSPRSSSIPPEAFQPYPILTAQALDAALKVKRHLD